MVPVFCIIFTLSLSGQGVRGGPISFDIDVATYRVKGEWSYAEVYFSVPRNHLTHSETGEIFEAYYEIGVNILLDDSLVSEKTWKRIDRTDSLNQITEGQHLYDQTAFYLKENKYRIQARITDLLADIGGWY